MDSGFKYSIENFRGLAIIFVVASHLGSIRDLGIVGEFLHFVVVNATAWFVFISGYLFCYIEQRQFNYKKYLVKKAKYVVLPYLLLSFLVIAIGISISRPQLLGLSKVGYIGWSLAVGGGAIVGPMWFIPMIVLFFFLSPLFNMLAKSRWLYLAVVFALIISVYTWRPVGSLNPFLSFIHFLGFYLLGISFAASARSLDLIARGQLQVLFIILGLLAFGLTYIYGYSEDGPLSFRDGLGVFNFLQFGKLCLLISAFFAFERYMKAESRVLGYFAKISFGLFFIQGFYMAAYPRIADAFQLASPIYRFFVEVVVVFVFSMVTVAVIKLVMGKRSRYVIGC